MSKRNNMSLIGYNRMNSEKADELLRPTQPINVVTATYLDPRRYYKFIHIWLYLATLFGAQIVQYAWISSLGKKWKSRLNEWFHRARHLDSPHSHKYKWFAFKEDYLPQSTQLMLEQYAQGVRSGEFKIAPLVTMGASYADSRIPNVVFEQNESATTTHVASRMVKSLNEAITELPDSNYQLWEAQNVPVWKSRFILAPKQLPTEDELDEISEEDLKATYDDPKPAEDEFAAYLFEEFLNDMEPEMNKRYLTRNDKIRFMLREVESNREEIIRRAILQIKQTGV